MNTKPRLVLRNGKWFLEGIPDKPAAVKKRPPTPERISPGRAAAQFSIQRILDLAAAETYVPVDDILSERRGKQIVKVRQLVMWLAQQATPYSSGAIGRLMRRDHATVLHAVKRTELRRAENEAWRKLSDDLLGRLKGMQAKAGVLKEVV